MPRRFFAAGFLKYCQWSLCGIENQGAAIAERDLGGAPSGALVILPGIIPCRFPFLVEPAQIRLVIGNPFLDGLPGRLDGLHGLIRPPRRRAHPAGFGFASVQNAYKPSAFFNIEGRRRWTGKMDDSFPEAVEAEEEFDFTRTQVGADVLHGALAARALERVATPHLEDEVTPEGPHVAGPAFGWCGDEEDLAGCWRFRGVLGFYRAEDGCGATRGDASGFIGIDAVVADSLLAFGREVVDGGGDEVGGFEGLEVAFDIVVAFGAVDDGLAAGIPGDFLEGEGMAEEVLGEAFTACYIIWSDDFLAPVVDVETGVFPGEEVGEFLRADESSLT